MAAFKSQFVTVLYCLLISAAVVWSRRPAHVYIASLREPDEVFKDGFPPLGYNDNLLDHVTRDSCQNGKQHRGTTAFVDTTANEVYAKEWGLQLVSNSPPQTKFFIYKILVSENFYNCYQSLVNLFKKTKIAAYEQEARKIFEGIEMRWLAYGGINAVLVEEVTQYERPDKIITLIQNPLKGLYRQQNPLQLTEVPPTDNPDSYTPRATTSYESLNKPPTIIACIPHMDIPSIMSPPEMKSEAKNQNSKVMKSYTRLMRMWNNILQRIF